MTSAPVTTAAMHVLQEMYAAEEQYLAAGGPGGASFEFLEPFFSREVVLHQAEALPYGGTWHGHDGMERFFVAMSQAWESFTTTEQTFLAVEGPVVVLTWVHARARATGQELDFPILQTVTVTDGLITDVRPFYWDTAAVVRACASAPEQ